MKRIRNSLFVKIMLLFLSFSCGFFSAYESFELINYYEAFSYNSDSVEDTYEFGKLYLKYLQRVCVYVKHREAGFINDPSSIYQSSDLVSVLTGNAESNLRPSTSVYDFTQESFEYYNRLLNIDCKNFFYYVKNLDTNTSYYSPSFKDLLGKDTTVTSQTIENYLKDISKKPSYLMLSTNNSLFSTNITSSSLYVSEDSSITWCINFLNQYFPKKGSNLSNEVTLESSSKINHYVVYTFYDSNYSSQEDEFTALKKEFDHAHSLYLFARYSCPISLALCLFFAIMYLVCAGHKKEVEGIYLNHFDRIYTEIALLLLCLLCAPWYLLVNAYFSLNGYAARLLYLMVYSITYLFLALFITTIVKRAKAHVFWSNSIVVRICKSASYIIRSWKHALNINMKASFQLLFVMLLFIAGQMISYILFRYETWLYLIICTVLIVSLVLYLLKFYVDVTKVIQGTHDIVNGDLNTQIPHESLSEPINQLAMDINNIRTGLSNAVEEQIKSERLKTELITNVSHDIKTPLTSIINYIDLLNKLNVEDETAQKYLKILTEKSWRLKNLIEDLVEASKASAGAIQMHPEKLNFSELVKQAVGEYEDRLLEHSLEPVLDFDSEDYYIYADGRSTFRVIENLLSNVCKYAMSNTRVYIRLTVQSTMIQLEMMNVSANKLGMKSDELIERFVRGDISRNTEGSGLGLSIANSLTTLQKGIFELKIDGDLFKALISLPIYQSQDKENDLLKKEEV
ncbi:MAG: HAMP domain-containing sensor histidine kinase [Clostridiales bacterium]|nr:HAMP domain-containing sensor histidine kinase [Clostridiales bacterium]